MSRISKQIASQIAEKMTQTSLKNVAALKKEFQEAVLVAYEEQIPAEVKSCFKKNYEWFYATNSIKLEGHGFSWEYVTTPKATICNSNSSAILKLTAKIADPLKKLQNKWQDAKKKHETLERETEQALLTCGTHARIKENLPEAIPFLPPPLSNALVVNFDSLRKRIKSQLEKKETVKS